MYDNRYHASIRTYQVTQYSMHIIATTSINTFSLALLAMPLFVDTTGVPQLMNFYMTLNSLDNNTA